MPSEQQELSNLAHVSTGEYSEGQGKVPGRAHFVDAAAEAKFHELVKQLAHDPSEEIADED